MNEKKSLTTEETFALAVQNHKKNNLQVAENLYKEILKTNSNHFQSNFLLGTLSAQIKKFDIAIQLLNKAIKIDPDYMEAHNNLGNVLIELEEFEKAIGCYEKAIQINPNYAEAHNNLGIVFRKLGEYQRAINCFEKAIKINPNNAEAHNNLGVVLKELGEYQKAKSCYEKAIEIQPNYASSHNKLGIVFDELGDYQKAISCYEKAIEIQPNYANAYNNLGIVFRKLGEYQKAISCYEKAIQINPNYAEAHNKLGIVFDELGDYQKAKSCYQKTIQVQPKYSNAYWNLHSSASDINEALTILKKLYDIDNKYIKAKIMISALQGFKGNFNDFDALTVSPESNHPYTRSIKWVFSLPQLPKIFFNRWNFYDAVVALTDKSRPFYEFGVWNGISFQYLINTFRKGYGFDTFTGLPESWNEVPKGTYSSFGSVPKITGGEFIVGEFKRTLPKFFSKKRPLASLINFDADLYLSTLCALNYSNKVIDEKSILIFDEFLMNKNWEKDEYKALNEFCDNFNISYDVLAVSFYSNQVAVKLKKN